MKSRVIAISAIATAFISIFLTLGAYIETFDLLALILSSVFVILPLYYKSYKGAFLCCLASTVLTFMLSRFKIQSVVCPAFLLFFGIYPIISNYAKEKNINKYMWRAIGLVWSVLIAYGIYFYYVYIMDIPFDDFPNWLFFIEEYILYFVGLGGIVFYFVYDRFIFVSKKVMDYYLRKVIK